MNSAINCNSQFTNNSSEAYMSCRFKGMRCSQGTGTGPKGQSMDPVTWVLILHAFLAGLTTAGAHTQFSNCTTTRGSIGESYRQMGILDTTATVRVTSSPHPALLVRYLHCNVTMGLTMRWPPEKNYCVGQTTVEMLVEAGNAWKPRIQCRSRGLIRVRLKFLEDPGSPWYEDNLVQARKVPVGHGRDEEWVHSVYMTPDGGRSVRYTIEGVEERAGQDGEIRLETWTTTPISVLILYNPLDGTRAAVLGGTTPPSTDWTSKGSFTITNGPDGRVRCSSNAYSDVKLRVLRCHSPDQCQMLSWCFKSRTCGNYGTFIDNGHKCSIDDDVGPAAAACQEVKAPGPAGLFQCSGSSAGGQPRAATASAAQIRWLGLDEATSYQYDSDTSSDVVRPAVNESLEAAGDIIRVLSPEPPEATYYTGFAYNFTCELHPFWSGGRARFFVGFGGNEGQLERFKGRVRSRGRPLTGPGSDEWSLRETISLVIPSNDTDRVVCESPQLGRENVWLRSTVRLRVADPEPPAILNTETGFQVENGDAFEVQCEATGQPLPEITWTTQGVDGNTIVIPAWAPQSRSGSAAVHVDQDGGSVLTFDNFSNDVQGTYTCNATNGVGTASKDFVLTLPKVSRQWTTVVAATGGGTLLLLVALAAFLRRFLLRRRRVLDEVEMSEFRDGMAGADADPKPDPVQRGFDKSFEISRSKFSINKKRRLGQGEYGKVYAGTATLRLTPDADIESEVAVAVKVPMRFCPESFLQGLLKELKIMTSLQHPHIVTLLRANTSSVAYGELFILMEYCEEGSLEQFLTQNKSLYAGSTCRQGSSDLIAGATADNAPTKRGYVPFQSLAKILYARKDGHGALRPPIPCVGRVFEFRDLLRWCGEVASGMEYLASREMVHRDLAARNILLTAALQAKVSDFGLSRQLYGRTLYVQQSPDLPLPCRWMAPECFRGTFTTASDAWAYGILAWEIFSLGELPYPEIQIADSLQAAQFEAQLRRGMRINERHHTTPAIFTKLEECWQNERSSRPSFAELRVFFEKLLDGLGQQSGGIHGRKH